MYVINLNNIWWAPCVAWTCCFLIIFRMKCRIQYNLRDTYKLLQRKNSFCRNGQSGLHRAVSTQASLDDAKSYDSIPGLSTLPIIGPLHHFLPIIGEIGPQGQFFSKLGNFHNKYGSIMKMKVFERANLLVLFEPEQFEQVYRAEEVNPLRPGFITLTYYREEMRQDIFKGVYGLVTAQGPKWRDFRTKVNPALLKPKLIKLYAPGLEEIADDMVARLKKKKDQQELLQKNLESELTKWSLESVALVALGARLGCLRDDLTEDHPARKLIITVREIFELATKLEFLPSYWKYIQTPNFKKIVKLFDMQWELSSAYVHEAMKKINSRGHVVPEEDKSILEKLLEIDEKVAIMMANEMLMAGIDTVTFATMCLLYQLAVNQRVQDKLREEIRSGNTQYLRACLKESLRIWHVVPGNLRRTSKEHIVGGYKIPIGIDVVAPNQYLSNHEKYYPRPNEFLPERWLADKSDPIYHGNAHPMVNLPFGFGVRSCIGRRIAELEIETFFKKLLPELKVTWEGPPVQIKTKLINEMEKPFRIKFQTVC